MVEGKNIMKDLNLKDNKEPGDTNMNYVILSDRAFLVCKVAVIEPVEMKDEQGRDVKTKIVLDLSNSELNAVVLTVDDFATVNKAITKALKH